MHSMKLLFIFHILVFIVAVSSATVTSLFGTNDDRGYAPTKKKLYVKNPYRGNERLRTRQTTNFHHSSSTSPSIEYAYSYTSESPETAWKPITYTLMPEYRVKDFRSTTTHGKIVPLDYGQRTHIPKEHNIILFETGHPNLQTLAPSNVPYNNYALLHYYVPFEHVTLAKGKPIEPPFLDVPKKPYAFEHVVKATIDPIPIYTTAATISSTTPAPKIPAPLIEENTEEKDNDFNGRYEYEYFVRDSQHGTNFGHKEYREGKNTKGNYEVVLPDGRVQRVRYYSDATGYHASVTYHPIHRKV